MIINTIISDYENRNAPVEFSYAPPAIKYLYPHRYGYHRSDVYRSITLPCPRKPLSYATGLGLEDLLHQRQEVIDSKIRMVLTEIDQRRIMKDDHLHRIDLDQCTCHNLIYHIGKDYKDRRRVDIEKKILDLEQEKRRERADYFRDILFLRKELRESFIEKLEEDQRADIFTNSPGAS